MTAPIPPIGTSHSPVPPPIRWYRKHTFWASAGSSVRANVPISASVAMTPRTRSSSTAAEIADNPPLVVRGTREVHGLSLTPPGRLDAQ